MANVAPSGLPGTTVAKLTGTSIIVGDDNTTTTVQMLASQLRTAMFAGGTGYTATDPLVAGAATLGATGITGGLTVDTVAASGTITSTASIALSMAGGSSLASFGGNLRINGLSSGLLLNNTSSGAITIGGGGGLTTISGGLTATAGTITLGTITTGVWNATLIGGTYGGTGVNNGASTITVGGNVAFSGAFTFAGTLTANTSVTFPTSGTLVNTAVTTLSSLTSIGTLGSLSVTGTLTVTGGATTLNGNALIWPSTNGTNGQILSWTTGGNLVWITNSGGGGGNPFSTTIVNTLGTITTNVPIFTSTATWNAPGVTFQGLLVQITNTASAAASNLLDLQVGGTSIFKAAVGGAIDTGLTSGVFTHHGSGGMSVNASMSVGTSLSVGGATTLQSTTTISGGNFSISTATTKFLNKATAVSAGTANGRLVTGIPLVSGTATISDSTVTANSLGNVFVTTAAGTLGAQYVVACSAGSFTVTSELTGGVTNTLDTSTLSIFFMDTQ